MMDLHKLRKEYLEEPFSRSDCPSNPLILVEKWVLDALSADLIEPNAMTLATAGPSARTVLLKEITSEGLIFYTNYKSKKGKEIEANPRVALLFFWVELQRQIAIEGTAQKISREDSETYFHSRPRESQIQALISRQSSPIENRQVLIEEFERAKLKWEGSTIPLPEDWGGYLVIPDRIEFWKGRKNRLHDRFLYTLSGSDWQIERVSP